MDKHKHLVPVIFVQKSRLQYRVEHILNEFTEITLFRFLAKILPKIKIGIKRHSYNNTTTPYKRHMYIIITGKPHLYTPIYTTLIRNTREFTRIIAKTQYNILYYIQSVE